MYLTISIFFWGGGVLIECYILSHMETDEIYNLGSKVKLFV